MEHPARAHRQGRPAAEVTRALEEKSQPMPTAQNLPPPPTGAPDAATVKEWLVGYIAQLLEFDRSEVRTNMALSRYGLDSTSAVALTGDLGEWLGREVDPRVLYEQKTIDALAEYVAQNHARLPPLKGK